MIKKILNTLIILLSCLSAISAIDAYITLNSIAVYVWMYACILAVSFLFLRWLIAQFF